MNLDQFLSREYRMGSYNCLHFAAEVWEHLSGQDIHAALDGLLTGRLGERSVRRENVRAFRELPTPVDPCLVFFQNPKQTPHVGVWVQDRVLHLPTLRSPQFVTLPTASVGFSKIRYAQPC